MSVRSKCVLNMVLVIKVHVRPRVGMRMLLCSPMISSEKLVHSRPKLELRARTSPLRGMLRLSSDFFNILGNTYVKIIAIGNEMKDSAVVLAGGANGVIVATASSPA